LFKQVGRLAQGDEMSLLEAQSTLGFKPGKT
jgi:hypothetical protein